MVDYSQGLSYDDVLLVPKKSPVDSRQDITLQTYLSDEISLDIPVLSAPMDTVTEEDMAIALGERGGLGTIHRFMEPERQVEQVTEAKRSDVKVGAAIGADEDYVDRAQKCVTAGADALMVDVAHGHMTKTLGVVDELSDEFSDVTIVAGNVATKDGVSDLYSKGADVVKVGVGPGSHCTTREVTGVGVPQLTAVQTCAQAAEKHGIRIIADGGIRSSGDAVKALLSGADTVMMGSFFMGMNESPGEVITRDGLKVKRTRGMATYSAAEQRSDKGEAVEHEEGVERTTEYKGPLEYHLREFLGGIRSGLSYVGGHSIVQARENAEFIRVTPNVRSRNGEHEGY